jgi:Zn-dependent protease with chaperone function
MVAPKKQARKRFYDIDAEAFVSPLDRAALQKLRQLPFLPQLVRKFNEFSADRLWYLENASQSIRCGSKQFPTLYRALKEACKILDAPEPELYLRCDPTFNAFSAGVSRPFILLHSALADLLEPDELLFVLGHELGHIKCGHLLYGMIGRMLIPMTQTIGQATLGVGNLVGKGMIAAFAEWMRQAEFSGDRAGLLVCQDPRTAYSTLMKIGCGSSRLSGEMSVDAFLDQARQYADLKVEGVAKIFSFMAYGWRDDHPQVVYRTKRLEEWVRSGEYEAILSGDYLRTVRPIADALPGD